MVFLAITRRGIDEVLNKASVGMSVWCSADAISEAEFDELECKNLTRFAYTLQDASPGEIEDAISTIAEHHPNETVWVEATPRP